MNPAETETLPSTPTLQGIGGWLTWFIYVGLGLGGLVDLVYAISYAASNQIEAAIITIISVGLAAVAFVLMLRKDRKGLLFARLRLGFIILIGALALAGSNGGEGFREIAFGVGWLCYLGASVRVRNTYPKTQESQ